MSSGKKWFSIPSNKYVDIFEDDDDYDYPLHASIKADMDYCPAQDEYFSILEVNTTSTNKCIAYFNRFSNEVRKKIREFFCW